VVRCYVSDNGTIFEAGALVEALDVCRTCVRMEREDFSRGLVHGAQAMRQSHVDSVTANGRWFILCGLVAFGAGRLFGGSGVVLTAVVAVLTGAVFASLRAWRSEEGLWLLSALYLVLGGFLASVMSYGLISDLREPGLTFVDLVLFGLACCLLWFSVYIAVLVTRWNWTVTNGKSSPCH